MKNHRIPALLLCGALLVSLSACGGGGAQNSPAESEPPAGTAVQVETVNANTISTENKVSGKVESDTDASVFVATAAKCTAVYVEVGDTVRAGQAICTLDLASTLSSYQAASISYDSTVKSYQDQAALFEKQIALYEKNLSDLRALQEIGAASQAEIDGAELTLLSAQVTRDSTLAQLEAGIQSSKANVEQLATALENVDGSGNVIAPISGVLLSLSAVQDAFVSSAAPVAVIDGVDQLKITVTVSEALVPKLKIGDAVDVTVSSVGAAFTGAIRSVEQAANAQTKLYTVTVSVPSDVSRHVCRRDLPYRNLCRYHRDSHPGHPDQRQHPVCLRGGGGHCPVCGGDHWPDRKRCHRDHLGPGGRAAAGHRWAGLPLRRRPGPDRNRGGLMPDDHLKILHQA